MVDARNTETAGENGSAHRLAEAQRVILLVAAPGTISNNLIFALEREFPWLVVEQVDRVDAACNEFVHPVALILFDCALLKEAEDASQKIMQRHPLALVAMIEPDAQNPICNFPEIGSSRLVRGVLPMNLGLDIWLSIVRLMLRGGEYFPATMLHSYARQIDARPSLLQPSNAVLMKGLTQREMQILEMVSRGLQNKQIAAAISLSENTVKIHLHHIIRKLGAHNRTEAAACFRNSDAAIGRIQDMDAAVPYRIAEKI